MRVAANVCVPPPGSFCLLWFLSHLQVCSLPCRHLLVIAVVGIVECFEGGRSGQKLPRVVVFHQDALIDDDNTVKVEDRVQAMRDRNDGRVLEGGQNDLLHDLVRVNVHAVKATISMSWEESEGGLDRDRGEHILARSFIHNDNLAGMEDGSSETEELSLAVREEVL